MSTGPAIELRGAYVRLGDVDALTDLDVVVEQGERIAVIGPSGAGKSTLIGLINGTVAATHGSVRTLGCSYGNASARQLRNVQRLVGTIHQRFDLVDQLRTVHNVNAGHLGRWSFWRSLLSLVSPRNLDEVRAALDRVSIGSKLHDRTGDLSGGEQQRVAIARVLVQRPEVILADEPVASLDPARGLEIINLLIDLSAEDNATLVASLHDVAMAIDRFERVIGLRKGRIAFDLPSGDLTRGHLRELYATEGAEKV